MSYAVSFSEIDEQHVELLPERTVMSLVGMSDGSTGGNGDSGTGGNGTDVLGCIDLQSPGNAITGSGLGCTGGATNPTPAP